MLSSRQLIVNLKSLAYKIDLERYNNKKNIHWYPDDSYSDDNLKKYMGSFFFKDKYKNVRINMMNYLLSFKNNKISRVYLSDFNFFINNLIYKKNNKLFILISFLELAKYKYIKITWIYLWANKAKNVELRISYLYKFYETINFSYEISDKILKWK